jgi:CheY-like chemotaxis protein
MLTNLGYSCEMACDGLEVVSKVTAGRFDLILMDIQMPNLDGLAATRRIRALGGIVAHIPIIALTANAMVEDKQAYIEAGMNEHVSKPIEIGKLALAITRVLSLERQI